MNYSNVKNNIDIYLGSHNELLKKDCLANLSIENNSFKISILIDDSNFSKSKYNEEKHSSDLNKKGNCISFYVLPYGKSNFYRFEATTDNRKTVHYYSKLKNGKYKKKKTNNKIKWDSTFIPCKTTWSFSILIPFDSINILPDKIQETKFLIVKYSYSDCKSIPHITNSMNLQKNKICDPHKWGSLSLYENQKVGKKNYKYLQKIYDMADNSQEKELTAIDEKNAILYVEKLNKIYKLLKHDDKDKYMNTIQRLEHFVNIPEFWSKKSNTIDFMNKKLDILIQSNDLNYIYYILAIIDAVIKGTEYLIEDNSNRKIKFQNNSEGQRLTANKHPSQKNQDDVQYESCFIEIWKKEKTGITFGRKQPITYIYENCKKNWSIKLNTFRKKYKRWDNTIPENTKIEDMKSISCKLNNKCANAPEK